MANEPTKSLSKLILVYLSAIVAVSFATLVVPTREEVEMRGIGNSQQFTTAQKVERLREYFAKVEDWLRVFYHLKECDKNAARDTALEFFRKPSTSTYHKLECGRVLLTWGIVGIAPTPDFVTEYVPFLIDAVLKQGRDEFMKARWDGDRISAVGEYAFIASGFEGHNPEHFEKLKDRHVIPVLIQCLDAPDYKVDPPMPSRGNVERQEIPIALARLNAVEAADKLKQVLEKHHDYWLRFHSAYALAFLLPRSESVKIEHLIHSLKDKQARLFFFGFGSGLVERGEAAGMQYLAFKYSTYHENTEVSAVLYMLEQRLEVLQKGKVKDTATLTAFYQDALSYAPLRAMLEFDASKLERCRDPRTKVSPEKRLAEVEAELAMCKPRILTCFKTILAHLKRHSITALSGLIAEIGEKTRCPEIRALSRE